MKKRFLPFLAFILMPFLALSQEVITADSLPAFDRILVEGKLTVTLVKAPQSAIQIRLNRVESSKLDWGLKDGILRVRLKGNQGSGEVRINYTSFSYLDIKGCNVLMENPYEGVMLNVDLSMSGQLQFQGKVRDLELKIYEKSNAVLQGEAFYYTLWAYGKTKTQGSLLDVQSAVIHANTGAEVYVNALDRLEVKASTASSVFYKGTPTILKKSLNMMSTLTNIGE